MGLIAFIAILGFFSLITIPTYFKYSGTDTVSFFQRTFERDGNNWNWNVKDFFSVFTVSSIANSQSQEVIRLWGWSLKLPPCWDSVATFMVMIWLYSYLLNVWCADLWNDLMEYPRFRNAINSLILLLVIAPAATGFGSNSSSITKVNDTAKTAEKSYLARDPPTMQTDEKTPESDNDENSRLLKYEETVAAMLEQINSDDEASE